MISILLILGTLCGIFYLYMTRNFDYWKKRGVSFLKPTAVFGNIKDICLWKTTMGVWCKHVYDNTDQPFIGFFALDEPALMIKDLDLVRNILIRDFDHFTDRTMTNNEKHDGIGSNILLLLKNPKWKDVRKKMSPAFTSGKIKLMQKLLNDCSEKMVHYLQREVKKNPTIDSRELFGKFAIDCITSTSFGIEGGCFDNEEAPFRIISKRIYNWQYIWHAISVACFFFAPKLVHLFRLQFIDSFCSNFFRDVFWNTMRERETTKVVRNDLIDILIEMRKQDQIDNVESLDGDILVAQATQFFIAGFETTSTLMAYLLLELARNPEIQDKVREEIIRTKNKHDCFSHDCLQEMEYLECTINEALRKYPVLPFLDRRCTKRYKIPGSDLVLEEGNMVYIPLMGIHYDPNYYPDPERFDPERFEKDNFNQRHSMTFLPFGDGPRHCIGRRFAVLNAKTGMAHLLSSFKVKLCDNTETYCKFTPKGLTLQPEHGVFLEFEALH